MTTNKLAVVIICVFSISDRIVCTDVSAGRLERLRNVLHTFGPGIGSGRPGLPDVHVELTHNISKGILRSCRSSELFDRVLVDVPCSTDRNALTSDKGSVFSRGKAKIRANIPITQKNLLL